MQIHDVSEYMHWQIPRPEFYIAGILPKQGVMLVYGDPGVRKSWLVEYLAFCVATGSDFLGMRTEQARTLLANFELPSIGYFWRLRDMWPQFALQPQMMYETSPSTVFLDDRQEFEQFAAEVRPLQPNLIILDCMSHCFGGDENSSREMGGFIRNVRELQAEHQCSIVLVHHPNKSLLPTSAMNKSRGHSKLTGWVDTMIYMVKQPAAVQLQFTKTRWARNPMRNMNIEFMDDYLWTVRGGVDG